MYYFDANISLGYLSDAALLGGNTRAPAAARYISIYRGCEISHTSPYARSRKYLAHAIYMRHTRYLDMSRRRRCRGGATGARAAPPSGWMGQVSSPSRRLASV